MKIKRVDDYLKKAIFYLRESKKYFYFTFILFILFILIGYFFPVFFQEKILSMIKEILNETQNLGVFSLIRYIFINNLMSSFSSLFLGIFLGIFSFISLIINSYVLGFVMNKSVLSEGIFVLWRLLPHGIFEIPALIISISLGLKLGLSLIYNCIKEYKMNIYLFMILSFLFFPIAFIVSLFFTLNNKKLYKKLKYNFLNSFNIFIFIIIPLLVIAAIIEGLLIYLLN